MGEMTGVEGSPESALALFGSATTAMVALEGPELRIVGLNTASRAYYGDRDLIGDVVGHGVGASALMGQLRAVLSERLGAGAGVTASLEALDGFAGRIPEAHAATVVVAEVEPRTGRVRYCTAGHPPPVMVSGGEARFLAPSGGRPLATGGGFPVAEAWLGVGDQLLLYSDGLIERPGRTPAQGNVELVTVAGRVARDEVFRTPGLVAVDRMCQQSLEVLTRETGYADDITILAAQRVAQQPPLLIDTQAHPHALSEVRERVADWLAPLDVRPLDQMAMQHALGEAVTNVIEHAYSGSDLDRDAERPLQVEAELGASGAIIVTVRDQGSWRYGTREKGGRGYQMLNGMCDHVTVDRGSQGTTVTLECAMSRSVQLMQGANGSTGKAPQSSFEAVHTGDLVTVRGPVDSATADELRHVLVRAAGGRTPDVRVELSEVTHLASAGVHVLFEAHQNAREQGIAITLLAPTGSVAQMVLGLVGLPHRPPEPDD